MFRDEMIQKKQTFYIPVTMDELMARFVTNIQRNECKEQFNKEKQLLQVKDLSQVDPTEIEKSVQLSFAALKNLLSSNTMHMERQPNTENHLYLKLMERVQEENNLTLINLASSKTYNIVKTEKPNHLRKANTRMVADL